MASKQTKRVTMADVASRAGVTKATVSYVLSGKDEAQMISELTRNRVKKIAQEIGYQSAYAARALATQRAEAIGFILSDQMPPSMAEYVCSYCIPGLEQACKARGYALLVSSENMSDADSFVVPQSVGQKRVDGLVFIHVDQPAIVEKFLHFGVPCVCLGADEEIGRLIPVVDADLLNGWLDAVKYAASLGHRKIGFITPTATHGCIAQIESLANKVRACRATAECTVRPFPLNRNVGWSDLENVSYIDIWNSVPAVQRPTLLMGPEHVLPHVLQDMHRRGMHCPRDLSLIATGEASPTRWTAPMLTAVDVNLPEQIKTAVNLLIDHLESSEVMTPGLRRCELPCRLLIRESVTVPAASE